MRVVTADNKEIAASYPRLRSSAATCPITECSSLLPNLQRAEFIKNSDEEEKLNAEVTGCQMRGVRSVEYDSHLVFLKELLGEDGSVKSGGHAETARSVLAKVRGDVFARFHAFAAKRRSRTRNSQFSLLVPELIATTTAV
jgi:hypothetical protein